MKILLIESDQILRNQYEHKLTLSDHQVKAVRSAQAAIDYLDGTDMGVELIVTDLNIASNNGVEIIHELKSYDDWMSIPIIVLSSVAVSKNQISRLANYGVIKYLYKPMVTPGELCHQIEMSKSEIFNS